MKYSAKSILVGLTLVAVSCSDDQPMKPESNDLTYKDTVVQSQGDELTVKLPLRKRIFVHPVNATFTFNAIINDSRCPVDVYCVWAGEVEVKITISSSFRDTLTFTIKDTDPPRMVGIGTKKYSIQLKDVVPRPGENKDTLPYAVLSVKEAD